jgi:hypothetical protein
MKTIRLWLLKIKAKRLANKLKRILDGYPCGYSLALHVCPDASIMATKLKMLWNRIRRLDPSAPHWPRLEDALQRREDTDNGN